MINLEVSGVHFELDEKTKQYVKKKIGRLDKYLNRAAKKVTHGDVALIEDGGKPTDRFTCEVTLRLPHETLIAKAAAVNIFAAIDAVEAKLHKQILRYKTRNSGPERFTATRRALKRLRRFGKI